MLCTQCNWFWVICKHMSTFISSKSTASQQHNGRKRVCRRDIDYASWLDTGINTAVAKPLDSLLLTDIYLRWWTSRQASLMETMRHQSNMLRCQRVACGWLMCDARSIRTTWHWVREPRDYIRLSKNALKNNGFAALIFWQMQAQVVSTSTKTMCGLVVKSCNLRTTWYWVC